MAKAKHDWSIANPEHRALTKSVWDAAHPDYARNWRATHPGRAEATSRAWASANVDRKSETNRIWRKDHPDHNLIWRTANQGRFAETTRAWRKAHPELRAEYNRARRVRRTGIETVIRMDSTSCALCHMALNPKAVFPDPMSTTIGHEPPLSRLEEMGATMVIERPEHLKCNLIKGSKLDSELVA